MNKIAPLDLAKKLKNRRREIDRIDRTLLSLLNQRLRVALQIGKIKKQMGMKIYDPRREKEILKRLRLRSKNRSHLKDKDVEKIFSTIIQVCRRSQK